MKFRDKRISVKQRPTILVGINPGRQRKGEQTSVVWEGNRSADFLHKIIDGIPNLYLTNLCNYQDPTREQWVQGIKDLEKKIKRLKPYKVVCLGALPYHYIKRMNLECKVVDTYHPSFILRFNKSLNEYHKRLFKEVVF